MRDITYILKRVIIGVLIATTIIFLKNSILTANALVTNPYLQVSGTTLPPGNFAGVYGRNVNLKVNWAGYPDGLTDMSQYYFVSVVVCRTWADSGVALSTDWQQSNVIGLSIQNTQMVCPFTNSPYNVKGKVTIITFKKRALGTDNLTGIVMYTANNGSSYYTDIQLLDINVAIDKYVNANDYANLSNSSQLNDLISATNSNTTAINNASTSIQNSIGTGASSIISNVVGAIQHSDTFLQELITRFQNFQDSITDDSIEENNPQFSQFNDYMASNGVITNLVALPITLYTSVLNSVNAICSSYTLGSLYGTNLDLPCINVSNYIGSTLWGVIDVIISGVLIYSISRHFVKVFNKMSSMEEGDIID